MSLPAVSLVMQAGATDSAEHLMAWARTAATCATRGEGAK